MSQGTTNERTVVEPAWLRQGKEVYGDLLAEYIQNPGRFRNLSTFMERALPTDDDRMLFLQFGAANRDLPMDDPLYQQSVAIMCLSARLSGSTLRKEIGPILEAAESSGAVIDGLKKAITSSKNALSKLSDTLELQQTNIAQFAASVQGSIETIPDQVQQGIAKITEQIEKAASSGIDQRAESAVTQRVDDKTKDLIKQVEAASDLFRQLGPKFTPIVEAMQRMSDAEPIVIAGRKVERKSARAFAAGAVLFALAGFGIGHAIEKPSPVTLTPQAVLMLERSESLNRAMPYLDKDTVRKLDAAIQQHG